MSKNMFKRVIALTSASVIAVSLLSSCGDSGNSNTSASSNSNANGSSKDGGNEASEGTTEVQMWGSWGGDQVGQIQQQLERYNSSQDKYHVTYDVQDSMEEKLITAHTSGDVPDAVLWDRFHTSVYAPKGAFIDIGALAERDNINLDDFYAPAVDELTYDGTLYGLPMTVDTRIIFYNKDMFEEAGVDPKSITDWDSLKDAAIKLTKRNGDILEQTGMNMRDAGLFNNWIKQAGGTMIDSSTTPATTAFNTQAGLDVLAYWDEMINQEKVYDLGYDESYGDDAFKAGKAAMTFNGPWILEGYKEADLNFGVIAQPVGPNGDKGAMMGGFGLIIPSKAKNLEGGWDFIKWWTVEPENGIEFAKITGNIPGNKVAAEDPYFAENEILSVFAEVLLYADIRSKVPGYSDMEGLALIPELQKYVAGEITAEEALENAQKSGDKVLADAIK